jgi:hypothetical protein
MRFINYKPVYFIALLISASLLIIEVTIVGNYQINDSFFWWTISLLSVNLFIISNVPSYLPSNLKNLFNKLKTHQVFPNIIEKLTVIALFLITFFVLYIFVQFTIREFQVKNIQFHYVCLGGVILQWISGMATFGMLKKN